MNGHEIAGWAWNLGLFGKAAIFLALLGNLVAAVLSFLSAKNEKFTKLRDISFTVGTLSIPAAFVDEPYRYDVMAQDPDLDPLLFSQK